MQEREILTSALIIMPKNFRESGEIIYLEKPLGATEHRYEVLRSPFREIWGWCNKCKKWQMFLEDDFSINNKQIHGIKYECVKCGRKKRRKTIFKNTLKYYMQGKRGEITF